MEAIEAIRTRRTVKEFSGAPISTEDLRTLIELATWAPNHRMTEPWRFAVVPRPMIDPFAKVVVASIRDDDDPKLLNKRVMLQTRLPNLGAFICVHRTPVPDDPHLDREDYAACCCAVQNLMLGAEDLGLGSFWSTGKIFLRPPVREFLGVPQDHDIVASLWLGVPVAPGRSRRKDASEVTTWVGEQS